MNTTTTTFSDPATPLPALWLQYAIAFRDFVETHGRFPTQLGAPTEEEAAHGRFIKNIRSIVKRNAHLTPEATAKVAWMDEHVPQWRTEGVRRLYVQRRIANFEDRVQELVEFIDEHGRFPADTVTAVEGESPLARFLNRYIYVPSGTWPRTAEREAALDFAAPGWAECRDNHLRPGWEVRALPEGSA